MTGQKHQDGIAVELSNQIGTLPNIMIAAEGANDGCVGPQVEEQTPQSPDSSELYADLEFAAYSNEDGVRQTRGSDFEVICRSATEEGDV